MKQLLLITGLVLWAGVITAQESLFRFGEEIGLQRIITGESIEGVPINWKQVNTEAETWKVKGKELICSGHPIGVIRSEKEYENFLLRD
jgi:hypothetical protein